MADRDWNVRMCVSTTERKGEEEERQPSQRGDARGSDNDPQGVSACQRQATPLTSSSRIMPSPYIMPYASAARGRKRGKALSTQKPRGEEGACFRLF